MRIFIEAYVERYLILKVYLSRTQQCSLMGHTTNVAITQFLFLEEYILNIIFLDSTCLGHARNMEKNWNIRYIANNMFAKFRYIILKRFVVEKCIPDFCST